MSRSSSANGTCDQLRSFSAIQEASPAGESARAGASVCGLVDCWAM
ncbi:hypothetical protein ACFQ2M_09065 [Kitasatospora saccharophila]